MLCNFLNFHFEHDINNAVFDWLNIFIFRCHRARFSQDDLLGLISGGSDVPVVTRRVYGLVCRIRISIQYKPSKTVETGFNIIQ